MNTQKETASHTPGPWTPTGHDGKQCVIVECQWGSVAKVLPIGAADQEQANARLIAAAPNLLSLLHRVLAYEQRLIASKTAGEIALVSDIRSTLAKAEGQA